MKILTDARVLKAFVFKSRSGRFLLSLAGIVLILIVIWYFKGRHQVEEIGQSSLDSLSSLAADASQSVQSIDTGIAGYQKERPKPRPKIVEEKPRQERATYFPISLYTSDEVSISSQTAPYGQLIEAKLVNTVDSINITTPIIGIVLRDIYNWDGTELVIPANTLIHGVAQNNRQRDRIGANDQWTLVWQDGTGKELPITGIVLDQAIDHRNGGWKITDASSGLKGRVIRTDRLAELKLIAASFISGLGEGLAGQETVINGNNTITTFDGSLKSAGAKALQDAADVYAQAMLRTIQQNGIYVRVPAGTNFYVYVTQPLDSSGAYPGASLTRNQNSNNR